MSTKNPLKVFLGLLSTFIILPAVALDTGERAPDFVLADQAGALHQLTDYRGQWVALYFYPKDDTPGCTTEAINFRDDYDNFKDMGIVLFGVSLDDEQSHAAFAEKYELPFPLLADTNKTTAESYGVYTKIGSFEMAKRETFIIDPEGNIAKHYKKVSPATHSEELLTDLRKLTKAD